MIRSNEIAKNVFKVTYKLYPAFVQLYEYTNNGGNEADYELLRELSKKAIETNKPILYNEEQRIKINKLRTKLMNDTNASYADSDIVRSIKYYEQIDVPDYDK